MQRSLKRLDRNLALATNQWDLELMRRVLEGRIPHAPIYTHIIMKLFPFMKKEVVLS
jgi:hypothetical protein